MKQSIKKARQGGFTLIEILIVIGIIAILAAIVLVAVNPAKHFREAANAQRSANVNSILNAVGQYIVDNKGNMPDGLDSGNFGPDDIEEGGMSDFVNFCDDLVPEYVGGLPADPNEDDQTLTQDQCNDTGVTTGYTIELDDNRVTICAPETVNVDTGAAVPVADRICVTR